MALPIDPMRLLGALRRLWPWLIVGAFAGLSGGAAFGWLKAKTRYEVSLQLIKRYQQPVFQFGVNGEPYKARQFTNSTLASAAGSANVLERVARRADSGVSVGMLKGSIEVVEDRVTDFVTLTLSGYHSAEKTVELAKIWTEEVINFTREMQSQDSREIRKVLETQLDGNQAELQKLDHATLKLAGGNPLMSADMQGDTLLRNQTEVEEKHEAARMDLEAINSKIIGTKAELARQTPAAEQLRAARTELELARTRFTDQNPLVIDKVEKVAVLETELKRQTDNPMPLDMANVAGTFVGNALYLRLVELENQRDAVERQMQELEKKRAKFRESPEDTSLLMELLQKKQMLRTAQSLLLSRMQEVRLFEENPPAHYGVFAPADLEQVQTKWKSMKLMVFTIAGFVGGTGLSLFAVLALGVLDPALRTGPEASKTLGAPRFATLPAGATPETSPEIAAKLWMRWIGDDVGSGRARVIWAPAPDATERDFWRLAIAEGKKLLPALLVVDCGGEPLLEIAALPALIANEVDDLYSFYRPIDRSSLAQVQTIAAFIERCLDRGIEVWLRLTGPVQEPATTLARTGDAPLLLVPLHRTTTAFWKSQADALRHSGCAPCGVIALNDFAS